MMADEVVQVREVYPRVVPESPGETASLPEVQKPVLGQTTQVCRKCGTRLTVGNWPGWERTSHRRICADCNRFRKRMGMKAAYARDPKKFLARRRAYWRSPVYRAIKERWRAEHPELVREYERRWRQRMKQERPGEYARMLARNRLYLDGWRIENRYRMEKAKFRQFKTTIDLLGGKCAMCGTTDLRVLTVDHINGGGNRSRERLKNNVYRVISSGRLPITGLQCLCFNCNCGVKRREWLVPFLPQSGA